jgi:hypothetical protein
MVAQAAQAALTTPSKAAMAGADKGNAGERSPRANLPTGQSVFIGPVTGRELDENEHRRASQGGDAGTLVH